MTDDHYHDDPIEETPKRKLRTNLLTPAALILGSVLFFQSTLAGNISLSSGTGIEFGQGVSQTVACSGSNNLTLTPYSNFVNASGGGGTHYFSSFTVSGIPVGCYGKDFTIRAYGNSSSTPLALFNSTSTSAVVYNDNGTFKLGAGSTGASITRSAGTFTFTFTSPVALSSTVMKVTIESSGHTEFFGVGDTGPGGGTIFYYSAAGFNCGSAFSATGSPTGRKCNYLEVAPNGWGGGAEPTKLWAVASKQSTNVTAIADDDPAYNNALGIGLGFKNSVEIVNQGNDNTTAAGAARAYTGGSKNDWYLPTTAELNLLCQWVSGVAPNVAVMCVGGSINSNIYGAGSAGFLGGGYWSSSEVDLENAWLTDFVSGATGFQFYLAKSSALYVRPIRAF